MNQQEQFNKAKQMHEADVPWNVVANHLNMHVDTLRTIRKKYELQQTK